MFSAVNIELSILTNTSDICLALFIDNTDISHIHQEMMNKKETKQTKFKQVNNNCQLHDMRFYDFSS